MFCVCVLAVWDWMAPYKARVRPCGQQWPVDLLWVETGGPSWFGEKSSLTGQGSLTACQPTERTHTHTYTRSRIASLDEDCVQKNCWESHTTLGAIKKIYFITNVVWPWLLQRSLSVCLGWACAWVTQRIKKRSVRSRFGHPVYTGTVQRAPTELPDIQSLQLTRSQDFAKIAAYLLQNCPISLNATHRRGGVVLAGAGPANYTWPQVLLILSCFSMSHNTLLGKLVQWTITNCFVNIKEKRAVQKLSRVTDSFFSACNSIFLSNAFHWDAVVSHMISNYYLFITCLFLAGNYGSTNLFTLLYINPHSN